MAITLQIRTMRKASTEISFAFVNDELKDTLLSWREKYQEAERNLENSNKELAEARKNAASRTQETEEIAAKLKINNMLYDIIGYSEVREVNIMLLLAKSVLAVFIGFLVAVVFGIFFVPFMKRKKAKQVTIRLYSWEKALVKAYIKVLRIKKRKEPTKVSSFSTPKRTRTAVAGMRIPSPGPLDDRGKWAISCEMAQI